MRRLGLHGVGGVPRAWLQQQELGYTFTPAHHQSVALLSWQQDAPARGLPPGNLSAWAARAVASEFAGGFRRGQLSTASLHDEPGAQLPGALPPVANRSALSSVTYRLSLCWLSGTRTTLRGRREGLCL